MRKRMKRKRVLVFCLTLAVSLSLLGGVGYSALAEETSGTESLQIEDAYEKDDDPSVRDVTDGAGEGQVQEKAGETKTPANGSEEDDMQSEDNQNGAEDADSDGATAGKASEDKGEPKNPDDSKETEENGSAGEGEEISDSSPVIASEMEVTESKDSGVVMAASDMGSGSTTAAFGNTVNFYVNLYSAIADSTVETSGTEAENFTTSVYSATATFPSDITSHYAAETQGYDKVYVIIQGNSSGNASAVDEDIRKLSSGYTDSYNGTYQLSGFPTDEEVFSKIKNNWNTYTKGKGIKVNDQNISASELTTDNYQIRWYVFKYNTGDYWHVDGILVPKAGILTVTKTFSGLSQAPENFEIAVSGSYGSITHNVKLVLSEKTDSASEIAYEKREETASSVTYTWAVDVYQSLYTLTESGYDADGYNCMDQTYTVKEINGAVSAVTEGLTASLNCVTTASDTASSDYQRVDFTNKYRRADDEPDENYIHVQKNFTGIDADQIPEDFSIKITGSNGQAITLDRSNAGPEKSEDGLTWIWKLECPGEGDFVVEEKNYSINGYIVTTDMNGSAGQKVTVSAQASAITFDTTSQITDCNSTQYSIGTVHLICAKLTDNAGYFVWSGEALSANQRAAVIGLMNGSDGFDGASMENTRFFSGDKIGDSDGLNFPGGQIRYDGTQNLYFDQPKQWSQFFTSDYTIPEGERSEVEIGNAYELDIKPPTGIERESKPFGILFGIALAAGALIFFRHRKRLGFDPE